MGRQLVEDHSGSIQEGSPERAASGLRLEDCLAPQPRASAHGVARSDAVAAARAPYLVPGWRAHH